MNPNPIKASPSAVEVTELLDNEVILKLLADGALRDGREGADLSEIAHHRRLLDHAQALADAHDVSSPLTRARMGRELSAEADALRDLALQLKLHHLAALNRLIFADA